MQYALDLEYIKINYANKLPRDKIYRKAPRYFSKGELDIIFSNAGDHFEYYTILLYTGLRGSDASSLTWANINLKDKVVSLQMEKTGLMINIPIHPVLNECLQNMKVFEGDDRLFHGLETDSLRRRPREHITKVLRKANITNLKRVA